MRNTLFSLLMLLFVGLTGVANAQSVIPSLRQVPNAFAQSTGAGLRLLNPGNLVRPAAMPTVTCGPDTVLYPLAKATGLRVLTFSNGIGIGQWYPAPQALTISGFQFYSYVDSATNQTVNLTCQLYLAGLDSLPTGLPLATTTVTVDSNFYNGNLALLAKSAVFSPAVVVNAPYVITIQNSTGISTGTVSNAYDIPIPDGQNEWLGHVFNPLPPAAWMHGYQVILGGFPFDADHLMFPYVTYDLTSSFIPNPGTGCSNSVVNFTNQSSPINFSRFYNQTAFLNIVDSTFEWNYGDGSPVENLVNGQHIYSAPGSYTVTLSDTLFGWTVTCVDVSSGTMNISIGVPPAASYSTGVSMLTVNFTDGSTNSPTTWNWDFGDGNTSTLQNPSHTYAAAGTYLVCLIASNLCGSDTTCQSVTVSAGCPIPASTFSNSMAGLNATFTDLSTNTPTSWFWSFGDGNTSTLQNPTHTYAAAGTYVVCLIATNVCGSDTTCTNVNAGCNTPVAGYTSVATNLSVQFTDASTQSPTSWLWDFGDGNTSTLQNPLHVYAAAGTYTVCLTAFNSCGSNQTCLIINVTCPTATASFTSTSAGLTANFTSTSTGSPTGYAWTFGDGGTSTLQNPSHTYAIQGTYQVCLTVTNACGTNQFCTNITITCPRPASSFSYSNVNLTYDFLNTTTGGATSYFWTFGNGTTSTQQNPSVTYANAGTFLVCLIATNSCGSDTSCQSINVVCAQPTANYNVSFNNLTVGFTNQSTGSPTSFSWNFGDGSPVSVQSNPSHTYAAPGTYQVCLTATNVCGSNTLCQNITVSCPAPSANFNFSTIGNTVTFTDLTTGGATTWAWSFGDGTTSSVRNPIKSYLQTGTFNVCLVVSSICGTDTFCRPVIIGCVPPTSNFSYMSVNDSVVNFTNQASPNSTAWTWTFGDGTPSTTAANPTHTYTSPGTYIACLIVSNTCGFDTLCRTVVITCTMPTAGYTTQVTNSVATFFDNSIGAQYWNWTFGDGLSSTQQNPVHTYNQSGIYTVCLTVRNFCGTNTTCQNLVISCNAPAPSFSFQFGTSTVGFMDLTTNSPTSWFWAFGDGSVSTQQNPTHGYLFPGQFYVCLTTTNACGTASFCQWVNVTVVAEQEEALVDGSFKVFPNPSKGLFNLQAELSRAADVRIRVSNLLGQVVLSQEEGRQIGMLQTTVDLGGVAKGAYILELMAGERRIFRNLIVD